MRRWHVLTTQGQTPLHTAALEGQLETAEVLVAAGQAYVNARDHDGNSPLHLAARAGHTHLIQVTEDTLSFVHLKQRFMPNMTGISVQELR